MSEISDKIEELIFLKRITGCELDGFADWSFKIGRFRFEKFKNLINKHTSYEIFFSGKKLYREFHASCNRSNIDFFCLDKENMSKAILHALDKETERETKRRKKEEDRIFRNCGNIGFFKRIFSFIFLKGKLK